MIDMLKIIDGNLFDIHCDYLVITVNCVGVMGKGVALECKKRYPEVYTTYRRLCQNNDVRPGSVICIREKDKDILLVATKDHWRDDSKIEWIETILKVLANNIADTYTIALPPLGCGNGNLNFDEVKLLMEQYLEPNPGLFIVAK